jgi:triosephosphate isomerase
MRTPIVSGNWKMNGSLAANAALLGEIVPGVETMAGVEVMVCPPFAYISSVASLLEGSAVQLGGQNLADVAGPGAFTGEISGAMLADVGCSHVLVGHSERRTLYGESDEIVAAKFMQAQAAGLVPVLCVGETLEERENGITDEVISRQAGAVISAAGVGSLKSAVLAYEPVWAIGTGHTASPEQAQSAHSALRQVVAAHDASIADELRILYGGSVKGANAAELFGMVDIDGGLIGGAALDANDFLQICAAASGGG